jgi:hypothetical protein
MIIRKARILTIYMITVVLKILTVLIVLKNVLCAQFSDTTVQNCRRCFVLKNIMRT